MNLRAFFGCLAATFLLGVISSSGQNAASQNPQSTLQQVNGPVTPATNLPASAALNNENPDLAGLQVVNKYPAPNTFTASTSQSCFWTDNAFLTPTSTVGSFGYNGRLQATYVPYATRNWTPSLSFEQQFVRYDNTSILDFDAETVRLASRYDFVPDKSWSWTVADSVQRLYTDRASLGEFYKENLFENEIDYIHTIFNQTNLFFLGSYNLGWHLTDPDQYCQVDNSLIFSTVYLPVPQVSLQAYFRPAIYAYTDNQELNLTTGATFGRDRTDYDVSLGLSATYTPIKQVSLTANFNWTGNYSNVGDREYRTISPAVTLSGSIGF